MKKLLLTLAAVLLMTAAVRPASAAASGDTPEEIISEFVARVQAEEYEELYNESFSVQQHLNSPEEYAEELKRIFGSLEEVQYKTIADTSDLKEYAVYSGNRRIAHIRSRRQDGEWISAAVFPEEETYIVEVPAGLKVRVNGTVMGDTYSIAEKTTATNLSGLRSLKADLEVDQYKLQGMIHEPRISVEGENGYTSIKDVTCNSIYVGKDVTDDEELQDMIIRYAQTCAMFPAQETGVGSVAGISVTDSDWYYRVSGVQNDWFTPHSVSRFTNQKVLKIVEQSEDTIIANVVFDYYAENSYVSRTWNCGYQMTLVNVGGYWQIAGMGIDSTMNPAYVPVY